MMNARTKPLYAAAVVLLLGWGLVVGGYALADHFKSTAAKLHAYVDSVDFASLTGADRAKALLELERQINALSPEERQKARADHLWDSWFRDMTESEKSAFLNATLPSGFKQMLASFSEQTPEKRHRAIEGAMKNLQRQRDNSSENQSTNSNSTNAPVLSEDLQRQVALIGLNSVYSDSSAETKAELAPLLEEIQKNMQSGKLFRGGQ